MFSFIDSCHRLSRFRYFTAALWVSLLLPGFASAQSRIWTNEDVDKSGTATSLAVDDGGNVHISYSGEAGGGLRYGFRPAGEARWFTMEIAHEGAGYTNIKLDQKGNPHICATFFALPLRYLHFDGEKWSVDQIASPTASDIAYGCAVAIAHDGTPHLTWYTIAPAYLHLRYAVLTEGAWMSNTLDWEIQTGKWNAMVLDDSGNPYVTYDAYVNGAMKCAHWDGKRWHTKVVDSRSARDYNIGMGNSVALDSQGNPHVSYYTSTELRYAWQQNDRWKIETVSSASSNRDAHQYRSVVVLDKKGSPHISYEDVGEVRYAQREGDKWHIQLISPRGSVTQRSSFMVMDTKHDILYISYRDPDDGSLKVAVGRSAPSRDAAKDPNPPGKPESIKQTKSMP